MPTGTDSGFGPPASVQLSAIRVAAVMVVERIEQTPDMVALSSGAWNDSVLVERIGQAVIDAANALREKGEIGQQLDLQGVIQNAREELLGLGPLGSLLDDDDVVEIHVHRYSWVSTVRTKGPRRVETPFASALSLERTIKRLCAVSGAPVGPAETVVERQIHSGSVKLVAVFPPVSCTGPVATLHVSRPATFTLEDHVRAGTMSRSMATFLGQAIAGHVNILVTAAPGADGRNMLAALLSAVRPNDHVVVARDAGGEVAIPRSGTCLLTPSTRPGADAVHTAARLAPDSLFVADCDGLALSEVLNVVAAGGEGIVAFMCAPTLRHAFARAVPEIVALRPGLSIDAVREWLSSSFDIAVEVVRMRDGRSRVSRIAEPVGVEGGVVALRDIYSFTVERTAAGGSVEGSFHPTGVVPVIGDSLHARGVGFDSGLFQR